MLHANLINAISRQTGLKLSFLKCQKYSGNLFMFEFWSETFIVYSWGIKTLFYENEKKWILVVT